MKKIDNYFLFNKDILDGLLVLYIVSQTKIEEKKCLQTLTAVRKNGKIEVYQKMVRFSEELTKKW